MNKSVEKTQGKAPKQGKVGNKNAEKFSKVEAVKLFTKALAVINGENFFLAEVADSIGSSRTQMAYVAKKFAEDPEVTEAKEKLYNRIEGIVLRKTAAGEIDKALGIFYLKACHGLLEVQRQELAISNLNDIFKKSQVSNADADDQQK